MSLPGYEPPGADSETLRRAVALVRLWRDPALPGLAFSALVALSGVAAIAFTIWKVAGNPYVPLQMPFLVSGGLGGTALIVLGSAIGALILERRDRAIARAEMQDAVDETASILYLAITARCDPRVNGRHK